MLLSGNENCECESNPKPYPAYTYLSESAFLVSFTELNKQFCNAKSVLRFFFNHRLIEKEIRNI